MDTLTERVKVKDVLFFSMLALISIVLHGVLLFYVGLDLDSFEKRTDRRQMMRVGFVERTKPQQIQTQRFRPSPKPDPEIIERPTISAEEPPELAPITAEPDEPGELPEEFSDFLKALDNDKTISGTEFRGDSYDILEGGVSTADFDNSSIQGLPEIQQDGLDPRVQVVINSYPPTSIERNHGRVRYPDVKIEKKDYQKGWTAVYIEVEIDSKGLIEEIDILRPKEPDELQEIFLNAVMMEIHSWKYDRKRAEIHVDVRFHVE